MEPETDPRPKPEPTEFALPMDLYEAGDPAFVDAIRATHDADALARFAERWYDDAGQEPHKRLIEDLAVPGARRLLLDYLDRPLNAYRHEGLIKRLFKKAEAAGDDPVMARFLVMFDRSVRRIRRKRQRHVYLRFDTVEEAERQKDAWLSQGFDKAHRWTWEHGGHVSAWVVVETLRHPSGTTMPRGQMIRGYFPDPMPDWAWQLMVGSRWKPGQDDIREYPDLLGKLKKFRLFGVATRQHLRRRAWRYFRKLGRDHPERYVAAACEALTLYRDDDMADGLALLDNWGLIHLLFHHNQALQASASGWAIKPGHSLAELTPSPIFGPLWEGNFPAIASLIRDARCRAVRLWAVRMLRTDLARTLPTLGLEEWVKLLGHNDPEVASLAAEVLGQLEDLGAIEPDQWLGLLDSTDPTALEVVCKLVARHVRADRVTLEQAVRLARARPVPVARLGFEWLRAREIPQGEHDRLLLTLIDAEAELVRPAILRWLRGTLATSSEAILEFLDSRHVDARVEGWAWFRVEPSVLNDVTTWHRLLESPHDDVRLALVAELESRAEVDDPTRTLDSEALQRLWAGVLLNVHRGSRAKPSVVRQLLKRLEARSGDAPTLLPLLGVALRSVRGPERRAALVALVRLVEHQAEVGPLVRSSFPELQWA